MNATELTKEWVKRRKPKEINWGKLTGIFQNLLRKYDSNEIQNAIKKYLSYYPNYNIEGFVGYCGRIIINERRKR